MTDRITDREAGPVESVTLGEFRSVGAERPVRRLAGVVVDVGGRRLEMTPSEYGELVAGEEQN